MHEAGCGNSTKTRNSADDRLPEKGESLPVESGHSKIRSLKMRK